MLKWIYKRVKIGEIHVSSKLYEGGVNPFCKAFTLAEVLITLAIIGVVASLTIPTLMKNYQEKEWKTLFKKTCSDLNQATKMIAADNDGNLAGAFTILGDGARDKYLEKMSYAKKCNFGATQGVCWKKTADMKLLNGVTAPLLIYISVSVTDLSLTSAAILINGVALAFQVISSSCSMDFGLGKNNGVCGYIYIDVNNIKPPNTLGKDIFAVYISKNGVMPFGSGLFPDDCTTDGTTSGLGFFCATKVMKNEDY